MSSSITIACGFLGGTIVSREKGYRVLQHPRPDRVFDRIADARWFLAVNWCDQCSTPAGILTYAGQLSFQNQASLTVGEMTFLPLQYRKAVFNHCLFAEYGEASTVSIQADSPAIDHEVSVFGLEIDPRYGKVAIVHTTNTLLTS